MFTEKAVEETVKRMAHLLFDYDEDVDVDGIVRGIDYENVTQYLRNRIETIYTYKAKGDREKSFDYFGKELVPQRGVLIFRELERGGSDIVVTSYEKELWILEDMTLAVIMCFSVGVADEDMAYSTEFRTFKGTMEDDAGFDICPEDMEELFQDMCCEQYEWEAPYYET